MAIHVNKLKTITFTIDGSQYDCQVQSYTLDPGFDDGDVLFSYCSSGSNRTIQEVDPNPTLAVTFYSDFRTSGISRYLWAHAGEEVAFDLVHLSDKDLTEQLHASGNLVVRPGPVGGDVRDNDMTEVTFQLTSLTVNGEVII